MERETATAGNDRARRGRVVGLCAVPALVGAITVLWLTRDVDRWRIAPLLILAAFTILSILTDVPTGAGKFRLSGVLIGPMLAMVLLGPAPAALLGAMTMLVSWARTRTAWY